MRKQIQHISLVMLMFNITLVVAQNKKNDTIKTGIIDVVKPYTPSISDAFKVKETPVIDDTEGVVKKPVTYNLFSFPVASTFTPAKGKAAGIEKVKPPKLFDNYATLGVGSFTTIVGDVYLNHAISRTDRVGGYFSHHSSAGDIDGVLLDNGFSDTKLNANYESQLRDLSWKAEAGFQLLTSNWYGLPDDLAADSDFASTLDVGHAFYNAHLGGELKFEDTYINSGNILIRRFGDDQGSAENKVLLEGKLDIPIRREELKTTFRIDYLSGAFDRGYFTPNALDYGNFIIGGASSYRIQKDELTLDVGVALYYLNGLEGAESKLLFYPNITGSYKIVDAILIAYGGVTGDVIQNSYHDFALENPFVSPTLLIAPTNQNYNVHLGLKGKVSSTMSYALSGRYISDNSKALFVNNTALLDTAVEDYQFGNSFGITYDNIKTFSVAGEFNIDVNRNLTLALKGAFFSYNTDVQAEAWNLPTLKGSLFLDYQIDTHWFTGANLFFVGERKDLLSRIGTTEGVLTSSVTLDSYFDANAHVGYHINDKVAVFAKVNNITNNSYQRWQNFQVQPIQFLAGATFKFDF